MKRLVYVFFLLFLGLTLSNCSSENDTPNFQFVPLKVVRTNLPDSFTLNETYEIEVTYLKPNGCTLFEGFDITKEGQTIRNVVVVGSKRIDTQICTEQIEEETALFNFVVLYKEAYTFKFWINETDSGEPRYIEIQVPVNP